MCTCDFRAQVPWNCPDQPERYVHQFVVNIWVSNDVPDVLMTADDPETYLGLFEGGYSVNLITLFGSSDEPSIPSKVSRGW